MNILKRLIPLSSNNPSRKWPFLLYSTTTTSSLNPPKPQKMSPIPQEPPAPPPSSGVSRFARPTEIPYQAKVANLVNLIGHIQSPIKFQTSPDGKPWAGTVIYQDNGPDRACLIPVLFEDDLAHVVTFHVKENDCVYVSGQLIDDSMPFVVSETPARFHLKVQNINFVEGFGKIDFKERIKQRFGGNSLVGKGENLDSWRDLVENSKQWRDYREMKSKGMVKSKFPDFKHKDSGAALWIADAPNRVLEELKSLDFEAPLGRKQENGAKEELWKSVAENPNQWWDNRLDKKNPKAPDFKKKVGGEGLWLSDAPEWFLSKLPPMGEKPNVDGGWKIAGDSMQAAVDKNRH